MRICLWFAAAGLGAALLAGCASNLAPSQPTPTPASNKKAAGSAKARSTPKAGDKKPDYSAKAVEARTEAHAHYMAGIVAELGDEPNAAAEHFHKAALLDSGDEELVMEAAGRLLRNKRTEQAIEVLRNSAARPQSSAELSARLGLAYSVAGKKELAIEANRAAIRKDPANFDGYEYLAQLFLQSDQRDEGLKVLDEAAAQTNVGAEFCIDLGEAYAAFLRGTSGAVSDPIKKKALNALRRAAAMNPKAPTLLQRLGDGFIQLGEPDLAIQHYARLLEEVPKLSMVRDRLIELYLRRQDRTNAALQLRASLRESPANPQAQYLLGSLYFEDRKLAEAEECFNKTMLLSPEFEPVYYDLAAVLVSADKPRRALEVLEKGRSRFRDNFLGEYYSAMAHVRLKDYPAAVKHLTSAEIIARATATNRLTHGFYFQIGTALERNQKFQEAETYFRKALAISPNFPEALNYLGYMWADRGENLPEARRMIEKAVELEPKNAAFLDSLGWVLFKQGHADEALKWIQKSIEHTEEPDATLYEHLGDIQMKRNEPAKARDAWRKSLEIEPNPAVEKKLKGESGR